MQMLPNNIPTIKLLEKKRLIKILDTDIILIPFEKCKGVLKNRPMTWWKAFTGIKHNRIEYFSRLLWKIACLYYQHYIC